MKPFKDYIPYMVFDPDRKEFIVHYVNLDVSGKGQRAFFNQATIAINFLKDRTELM